MPLSANIKSNQSLETFDSLKSNVFRVKVFDSSHSFSANQKHAKIQVLTQATPTFNNGINGLYYPVPQKYVCRDLVAEFFL